MCCASWWRRRSPWSAEHRSAWWQSRAMPVRRPALRPPGDALPRSADFQIGTRGMLNLRKTPSQIGVRRSGPSGSASIGTPLCGARSRRRRPFATSRAIRYRQSCAGLPKTGRSAARDFATSICNWYCRRRRSFWSAEQCSALLSPGRRSALRGHEAANQTRIPVRTGG